MINDNKYLLSEAPLIKLSELYENCHYKTVFNDKKLIETVGTLFQDFLDKIVLEDLFGTCPVSLLIKKFDDQWDFISHSTGRTLFGFHPKLLNQLMIKFFYSHPGRGNPLSHMLRAPMSQRIYSCIKERSLDELRVPKKGIIPFFEDSKISNLGEYKINNCFAVLVEFIDGNSAADLIENVKNYPKEKQIKVATQICELIANTGLGDANLQNFMIDKNDKWVIIDTEPLYAELNFDGSKEKFRRCNEIRKLEEAKPKNRALFGLTTFRDSAKDLNIFVEIAQTYINSIEKMGEINSTK